MFKKVAIIRCNKLWDMMRSVINFVINIAFDRTHVFSIRNITRDNNRKKKDKNCAKWTFIKYHPTFRFIEKSISSDRDQNFYFFSFYYSDLYY